MNISIDYFHKLKNVKDIKKYGFPVLIDGLPFPNNCGILNYRLYPIKL